jgi:hypothetical protein
VRPWPKGRLGQCRGWTRSVMSGPASRGKRSSGRREFDPRAGPASPEPGVMSLVRSQPRPLRPNSSCGNRLVTRAICVSFTGHENRGATAFPDGVIKLYRRRFELAHRALAKASNQPLVTPAALLGTCADKARHVLLHELYHCKQYGGRPRRRSRTSGSRGLCRRKRTSLGRPSEAGGQVAARVSNYRVVFIPEQNRRA